MDEILSEVSSLPPLWRLCPCQRRLRQRARRTRAAYSPSKTPWGDPDLQGIWPGTDMVGVPFERPERFGSRLFLTDAELKEREQ